jgi:hypothetical protein
MVTTDQVSIRGRSELRMLLGRGRRRGNTRANLVHQALHIQIGAEVVHGRILSHNREDLSRKGNIICGFCAFLWL